MCVNEAGQRGAGQCSANLRTRPTLLLLLLLAATAAGRRPLLLVVVVVDKDGGRAVTKGGSSVEAEQLGNLDGGAS